MPDSCVTVGVLPKASDLEVHVRVLTMGSRRIVELIDHVPSLGEFGRGFWIPVDDSDGVRAVAQALLSAADA